MDDSVKLMWDHTLPPPEASLLDSLQPPKLLTEEHRLTNNYQVLQSAINKLQTEHTEQTQRYETEYREQTQRLEQLRQTNGEHTLHLANIKDQFTQKKRRYDELEQCIALKTTQIGELEAKRQKLEQEPKYNINSENLNTLEFVSDEISFAIILVGMLQGATIFHSFKHKSDKISIDTTFQDFNEISYSSREIVESLLDWLTNPQEYKFPSITNLQTKNFWKTLNQMFLTQEYEKQFIKQFENKLTTFDNITLIQIWFRCQQLKSEQSVTSNSISEKNRKFLQGKMETEFNTYAELLVKDVFTKDDIDSLIEICKNPVVQITEVGLTRIIQIYLTTHFTEFLSNLILPDDFTDVYGDWLPENDPDHNLQNIICLIRTIRKPHITNQLLKSNLKQIFGDVNGTHLHKFLLNQIDYPPRELSYLNEEHYSSNGGLFQVRNDSEEFCGYLKFKKYGKKIETNYVNFKLNQGQDVDVYISLDTDVEEEDKKFSRKTGLFIGLRNIGDIKEYGFTHRFNAKFTFINKSGETSEFILNNTSIGYILEKNEVQCGWGFPSLEKTRPGIDFYLSDEWYPLKVDGVQYHVMKVELRHDLTRPFN